MDKYIGFDLGDKKTLVCIISVGQKDIYVTIPTDLLELQKWLVSIRMPGDKLYLTFEASAMSGYLYDGLKEYVDDLVVCNPSAMPWIYRTSKKSDRIDANKMAKMYMLNMLPAVHMPSKDVRMWRSEIQHRKKLVYKRSQTKNEIRSLLKMYGIVKPKEYKCWWTKITRSWMREVVEQCQDIWALNLSDMLGQLDLLEDQIKQATKRLDEKLNKHTGYALLKTIPGVGPRTTEAILAYTDDIDRFAKGKQYCSYFGLTPKLDQSGNVCRNGHISKQGPSVVRWLVVECVWQIIRLCEPMRKFYERVLHGQKGRRKIAVVATARKLLSIVRAMLKTGEVFNENLVLKQERHNKKDTIAIAG